MGMFTAGLAALSTLYPDARDVEDPEIRQKHVLNAIAKVPTLAASAAAYRSGYPGAQSNEELSYVENFYRWLSQHRMRLSNLTQLSQRL